MVKRAHRMARQGQFNIIFLAKGAPAIYVATISSGTGLWLRLMLSLTHGMSGY